MPNEQLAINTYRRSVSRIVPEMTKVALLVKGDQLQRGSSQLQPATFSLSPVERRLPEVVGLRIPTTGPGAHVMAAIFKVTPKVGSAPRHRFQRTHHQDGKLVLQERQSNCRSVREGPASGREQDLQAPNIDLDTGKPTQRGEYPLADATYRELLDQLAADRFANMDDALRENILRFYDGLGFPPPETRIDKCVMQRWSKTWIEVTQLRSFELLDAGGVYQSTRPAGMPPDIGSAQPCSGYGL